MKNRAKITIAFVMTAVLTGGGGINAQQSGDLDRQVEVSRDYAPEMGEAVKLDIEPQMVDTVALKPEVSYSIEPTPWRVGFGVEAINPVKITTSTYDPSHPIYMRIGAGAPLNSLFDLHATTMGRKGVFGGYANHYGRYNKIKNELDYRAKAIESHNRAGIFGGVYVTRSLKFEAEAGIDWNVFSRYGSSIAAGYDRLATYEKLRSQMQSHTIPHLKMAFGSDFNDLTRLNIRAVADIYHLSDRDRNKETGIGASLEFGKRYGIHRATLKAGIDAALGSKNLDYFDDKVFTITPTYGVVTKRFKLSVGADMLYDIRSRTSNNFYFLPQFNITFGGEKGVLVPYIDLQSSFTNNSYRSLTARNPYFDPTAELPIESTREYNLRGGIFGKFSPSLSYRVFAGLSLYKDPVYFANSYQGTTQGGVVVVDQSAVFEAISDKRTTMFIAGVELEGRISGSFMAGVSAHIYNHSLKGLKHSSGDPKYDASLHLRYKYRDKFSIKGSVMLIGKRKMLESISIDGADPIFGYNSCKAAVDISLEAEYFIRRSFGLFVLGQNLGNSKIYRFNNYPDQGIAVTMGVKMVF